MEDEILDRPRPVGLRGTITIPQIVLEKLEIEVGKDQVYFKIIDGKMTINKAKVNYEYVDKMIK